MPILKLLGSVILVAACAHTDALDTSSEKANLDPRTNDTAGSPSSESVDSSGDRQFREIKTKEDPNTVKHEWHPCPAKNPAIDPVKSASSSVEIGIAKPMGKEQKPKTNLYTRFNCDPAK